MSMTQWIAYDDFVSPTGPVARYSPGDVRAAAEAGSARVQYFYASMLHGGWNVRKNEAEAERWFARAAKQGEPRARLRMGGILGSGKQPDYGAAIQQYLLAADQIPDAMGSLHFLYHDGHGVRRYDGEVLRVFERYAADRWIRAYSGVGMMHENGWGTPANAQLAYRWYRDGMALGDAWSRFAVGRFLYDGLGGAPKDPVQGLVLINQSRTEGVWIVQKWLSDRRLPR